MKKLRVLALMHEQLIPPETMDGSSEEEVLEWKTEFDVLHTLRELGHDARPLGVSDDLGVIRKEILGWKPHITFNLLEEFLGVAVYDQHVVSYLELMCQPYTGCNPRGLLLSHDKALCKKLLSYHRIPTPRFAVFSRGRVVRKPRRWNYPLLVKSVIEESSLGITQDSLVHDEDQLRQRVTLLHDRLKTDALVEEYIEGRELYVGVLGNRRLQTFPVWEMLFRNLPENLPNIATARVKWDPEYQKKVGIVTQAAQGLSDHQHDMIAKLCKRIYRILCLSGYARMDLRLRPDGRVFVLEANPNPNLSFGEDYAESAELVGIAYGPLLQRIVNLGLRYRPAWRSSTT